MPVLTYLHQLFNAALLLDSRGVELRIVCTDGIPFHEPLQESNGAGQHHESDCALIEFRGLIPLHHQTRGRGAPDQNRCTTGNTSLPTRSICSSTSRWGMAG